ncbi:unnamed protein product [Euphydryas editha]|uniref:Uncharacterized protein n=1 Tax=Euphydryas editha TaxID=104508 RepID=A0AAU9TP44_EUPED|nr:unnamed protein product [Euphydryas editha]
MPGTKFLKEGAHLEFDVAACISDGRVVPWKDLCVYARRDGNDLVYLTSEASGELTTLTANTIVNLTMQEVAIKWLHNSDFGRYYNVLYMKGVGDDAEWIGTLSGTPPPKVVNAMLEGLKQL